MAFDRSFFLLLFFLTFFFSRKERKKEKNPIDGTHVAKQAKLSILWIHR